MRKRSDEDRFWDKIKRGSNDECWEWTACRIKDGYGHVQFGGQLQLAHRVSWRLAHGPIPDGFLVCHNCDNPSCVNPNHLWLGTHQQNMDDMAAKCRRSRHGAPRGIKNGSGKLTDAQIAGIRILWAVQQELRLPRGHPDRWTLEMLGAYYGVCFQRISQIVREKTRTIWQTTNSGT